MTKTVARAVLAAGILAGTFGFAAPASAFCDPAFYAATGYCNACYLAADVTNKPMNCLA